MANGRLTDRNLAIAEMLSDGEQLKNFYRFIAQNPHINLHDACQIVIERPNATVCYTFSEWAAMDRRVTKGRKGIAYYDNDGYKHFVFDANDTHGDNRYSRPILPMKRLLDGLDELNGTEYASDERSDYRKIHKGVQLYLQEQGELTADDERNKHLIDGIAFSLYSKTGFPKSAGIRIDGLPYSYAENAEFVKDVYIRTDMLVQDIEEAYSEQKDEITVVDDTDEETLSDEPIVKIPFAEQVNDTQEWKGDGPESQPTEQIGGVMVFIQSAVVSNYRKDDEQYDVFYKSWVSEDNPLQEGIYLGKRSNYDNKGGYDNSDNSLIFLTENDRLYGLFYGEGFIHSQQKFIDEGIFTEADYKEFNEIQTGILKDFEVTQAILFDGAPFRYPDWNKAELTKQSESKHPIYPMYKRYMELQATKPNAVVLYRLGDFYEAFDESARQLSAELDLTLTGRDVGLKERVPMCGIPYHALDKYLDKILKNHSVLLADGEDEPKYILSYSEMLEQSKEAVKEQKPTLVEIEDNAPTPFDAEQEEADEDWRNELAEELTDSDEQKEAEVTDERNTWSTGTDYDEYDEDESTDELEDFDNESDEDEEADSSADEQESEQPKDKVKSTPKKRENGIKDRKRKNKAQPTLFDYLTEPQEQSQEEKVIEYELKRGSHFQDGKFRIFDKYQENPTAKTFAEFLKNEYGEGGSYVDNTDVTHNSKGIRLKWKDEEHPENNFEILLKWSEVANRIADLIDDGKYFSEQEIKHYDAYKVEQNRQQALRAEESRQKSLFLERIVLDEPTERKERIKAAYYELDDDKAFVEYLKSEYGAYTTKELDSKRIVINDFGIYVAEYDEKGNTQNRYMTEWETVAEKISTLINKDRYLEPVPQGEQLRDLDAEEDDDWDRLIDERILKPVEVADDAQDESKNDNTDLSEVLDQSELGGAKTRFRGNVAAIKLVNKLYADNRNPTDEEKKVLSRFVGWGGLSQAFDENNKDWAKEYSELKMLLSQEDYEQARSSTLNAYYTAKDVIGGIYSALDRFGVKGNNRILEPSMGTGNFFGFMPQEIADGARLYGVELDNLTGRIAAKLYPQANVQIKGFEETSFPNDKFDIVVGNVPFGGYGVADSDYNRYNFKVHDYFLAKSVDKVKPNGIVAIVTSKGTMDKLNPSARKYVAERAELLGAIRLPNTAFKQTAGTEAVADILFFRKRTERLNLDSEKIEWLGTGKTAEGYEINSYFINHPEMVLGTLAEETGLYGGKDVTVKPDGRELSVALSEAIRNLPQGFYSNPEESPTAEKAEVDYNVKPMCYKAESGRLYMRIGDEMVEQRIPSFPKDAYQRIQGMIALREELHHILDIQIKRCSDEVLQEEQRKLNGMYDLFVGKYGNLNSQTNTRLFKEDGDSALLFACEDIDEETKTVSKAEIFFKRTIRPYVVPTSTDDPFEALQISRNERGRVDIAYIEELTGKSYDDVLFELGDAVFRNPEKVDDTDKYSGFETAEEYLSGRVVEKLNTAREYAEEFPEYERNVTALEQVQPTPLTASEISVRLGQTWVDKRYYKQFYCELIGLYRWRYSDVELFCNPFDSSWRLDQKDSVRYDTQMMQKEVYGTSRAPAYRLFIDCMNLKATTIYDTVLDADGKERRVLNQAETIAAREKQNKIREEFTNWIYADPKRRDDLEETYNRLFNQIRLPSYDGSYLQFPEMNPAIELKPHQKNAVHRIIVGKESTLLHHVVGSGKTYTMAASIMKMRQLGLCKKAMVAVPNHLVQQWASEWRKLYPNAKILVATKEDLDKDNRKKFVSKVALGDWDGIIIAQSSFAKIPISRERQIKKLQQEIAAISETVKHHWEEYGMPKGAVKNLERIKRSREAALKKLMDGNGKDDVLTFENLGVDYLYVDEAHYYKNLFLFTKMNNVAGLSNAASQRASDLKLKCEYLQELHGSDRGVVFATGTPISNSMAEMYTMQTYLQPKELERNGITFFDGWAADFGETVTSMELAPSGKGYQARTRFAKFTNLPELLTMYRSFADVQTQDMVKLNVPEAERHVINLKPSDTVIELAEQIAERAQKIHDRQVSPEEDNMLKITSDGKKLALDPRCFVPDAEDEEGSKLNEAAQRIHEIWEQTAEGKGTQIVFCDLSTPKVRSEEYTYGLRFDVYNDLKYKLVQKGIPANEIAFIHDANTDEQKQTLFDKVNSGAVRVLIGSTEKCGAGTNVQKRLVALHHLDTPYRPSDMEQREGRIIRQGNMNKKVDIYTYVTERTFDSYSYQILENKQKFISQINKGDLTVREAEDIDETTLSYAEIKAITAANPRIKRKMEVDTEIARLRILEGQYKKNLYALQDKIRKDFPEDIRKQELLIERVTADLEQLQASKPTDPEAFEISVNGKVYTDKKEGGKALNDALFGSKPDTVVAEYCGFKISMNPMTMIGYEREITLTANGQYTMKIGDSASGNLTRLDNFIEDFPKRKERLENRLKQLHDDLEIAKEQVQKPFEHKAHLAELLSEQTELNAELNLDKKEEVIIADENDEDDGNYKAIPTQGKGKVDEIIDKEDKVAAMQVAVLPDYSITQEAMHRHGYTWDGMLPLTRSTAIRLWGMGLTVNVLNKDDTDREVKYDDFNVEGNMFGIEKPVWNNFLNNEKSLPYFFARSQFAEAARVVTSDEMSAIDEKFTITFINNNHKERTDLNDFLADKPKPDSEYMKPHTSSLLYEFAERIWCDSLKYYGWVEDDVQKSIVAHLEDAELKKAVQFLIDTPINSEKEEEMKKPVYLQSFKYADEHNEVQEFRESHKISELCKKELDEAIRNNFDGMHLNADFENALIDKYGVERVAYIVATTINEHEYDGRYSRANKEWAKTIPMSDSESERSSCCLNIHPAILDGFTDRIRNKLKEEENRKLAQDKYLHFTARGDKVLSIVKDRDDRNIAIVQREKLGDFVVAAGYDTTDGTWKAGRYDFATVESAEQYRTEKYGFENTSDTADRKWLTCKVSPEALIKKYQFNSRFKMPTGSGYEGYAYSVFNDRIKEGTITTDLKSDTRERALVIRIPTDSKVELRKGEETIEIEPHDFISLVNETASDKYEREQRYIAVFPPEAIIKEYDTSMLLAMPNDTKYKGYVYYLPTSVVNENKDRDDGSLIVNIGESFKVTLRKGEEKIELAAKEYSELVGGKKAEQYKREPTELDEYREQSDENDKKWNTVAISENAVINNYKESTLFKMPQGDYSGFVYYIPSGMVRKEDDGLYLRVPEDFVAHLKNGDEKKDLTAQEFIAAIDGKTDDDYKSIFRKPSEEAVKQFEKVEGQLRRNVPEEMRNKPNWVVVRTRENEETGRLDKFLINPHTGKFAESDNPETWTDFDTACKYAKENGGVCLAYALDGKDGIACIDLDGCMEENGDFSEIAQQSFNAAKGSYAERSVSGKGLHIFGKTKGADLRSFSKDKTMEYYQGGHFIAMTGDFYGSSQLKSFDTPEMKSLLERKLEKRTEWKNTGAGIEGLSSMDDREMLDKAFAAKNGDKVKKLYNGVDVQNNHSNSDMSLMNYLAFWSNHDIDQMLRVFATSGLYRPDKPQSYYEHTAIKAVKGTPCYTPPKASNNKPNGGNGNGSGKDGK